MQQATEERPGSLLANPYKKDVEATARLVTCLQPTGSKKRGHTKAENMSKRHSRKAMTLVCVVRIFVFQQQNIRKLDVLRGV